MKNYPAGEEEQFRQDNRMDRIWCIIWMMTSIGGIAWENKRKIIEYVNRDCHIL
jgi:hypothetical protein